PGWTAALELSKEVRQLFYFVEKRMSAAEICYNMHASPFHVYGQLYDLVAKGIARVEGEVPEDFIAVKDLVNLPASIQGMLTAARMHLDKSDVEGDFETIQGVLEKEPNNSEA